MTKFNYSFFGHDTPILKARKTDYTNIFIFIRGFPGYINCSMISNSEIILPAPAKAVLSSLPKRKKKRNKRKIRIAQFLDACTHSHQKSPLYTWLHTTNALSRHLQTTHAAIR